MIIAVASGKGGTGKTTVATNLALALQNSVYLDCDVEEPNGHLFLKPVVEKSETVTRPVPRINHTKCDFCGECSRVCESHAITVLPNRVLVFDELCNSCGACTYFCPQNAIWEEKIPMGVIRIGKVLPENIGFFEGCLKIGELSPSPLIGKVVQKIEPEKINILDAAPGASCSMIETVRNADYCLLITEPTPFGLNDLELAVEALKNIEVPFGIVINKARSDSTIIDAYCEDNNIPILMRFPFNRRLAEAYSKGELAVRVFPELKEQFQNLFNEIKLRLQTSVNVLDG